MLLQNSGEKHRRGIRVAQGTTAVYSTADLDADSPNPVPDKLKLDLVRYQDGLNLVVNLWRSRIALYVLLHSCLAGQECSNT